MPLSWDDTEKMELLLELLQAVSMELLKTQRLEEKFK